MIPTDRFRQPRLPSTLVTCIALLWLNSCAVSPVHGGEAAAPQARTQVPAMHAALADALRAGEHAQADAARAEALLAASQRLREIGAQPLPQADDLADIWQMLAAQRGVTALRTPKARRILRGRALGAAYRRDVLAPNDSHDTQQVFLAGTKAVVTVVPLGEAPLQVQVRAGDAEAACTRTIGKPQASCHWIPEFTQRYTISVRNPGSAASGYYLIVN